MAYPRAVSWSSVCVAAVLAASLSSTQAASTNFPAHFIVGVGAHFGQHKGLVPGNLDMMRQAHITWFRDDMSWGQVEAQKGHLKMPAHYDNVIHAALQRGLQPLLILDYGNKYYPPSYIVTDAQKQAYTRFCKYVVTRYKGKLKLYEIWNEWGGIPNPQKPGNGTPQQYAALLAYVVPRLRKIDPSIKIVGGWRDNAWLDKMMAAGGLQYLDGYSVHPYMYGSGDPEGWARRMQRLETKLKAHRHGQTMPVYVTEVGWPTYQGSRGTPPIQEGAYIARLYLLARTMPFIKGVWWYDFQDDGWDPKYNENNFGIVRPDLTPKPAYAALTDVAPLVQYGKYLGRVKTSDTHLWVLRFKRQDGKDTWAIWWNGAGVRQVILHHDGDATQPVTLKRVGQNATHRTWHRRPWAVKRSAAKITGELSLTVSGLPYLITGDLSGTTISQVIAHGQAWPISTRRSPMTIPKERAFAYPAQGHPFTNVSKAKRIGDWKWGKLISHTPRHGQADLSGWFAARYDANHLYLLVNIRDNRQYQPNTGSDMWEGDSIQMDFQALRTTGSAPTSASAVGLTELTVALTHQGPEIYRQITADDSAPGPLKAGQARITRANGHTQYAITIPVKAVGLPALKPGSMFRFVIAANDNDGGGRKSFIHWGSGLVFGKDPAKYGLLLMAP